MERYNPHRVMKRRQKIHLIIGEVNDIYMRGEGYMMEKDMNIIHNKEARKPSLTQQIPGSFQASPYSFARRG
jgi:hypothetical protein